MQDRSFQKDKIDKEKDASHSKNLSPLYSTSFINFTLGQGFIPTPNHSKPQSTPSDDKLYGSNRAHVINLYAGTKYESAIDLNPTINESDLSGPSRSSHKCS